VADLLLDALSHHPQFELLLEGSHSDLAIAMDQHARSGDQHVCEHSLRQDMAGTPSVLALPVALSHPRLKDKTIPTADVCDGAICLTISEGSHQHNNTDSTSFPTPTNHAVKDVPLDVCTGKMGHNQALADRE
jgi:hypothetical protein